MKRKRRKKKTSRLGGVRFERKDAKHHVGFLRCPRETTYGRKWYSNDAVRAVKESCGWRVDKTGAVHGAWMPWEPITDTCFKTLAEAKKRIRTYAKKCKPWTK
jgi:hypothetical protein